MELSDVIQEALLKGILSIVTLVGKKAYKKSKKKLTQEVLMTSIIEDSLGIVTDEIKIENSVQKKKIQEFLLSQEVESIVRQIVSAKLTSSLDIHKASIEKEFYRLLALHLGLPEKQIKYFSEKLLALIIDGCQKTLNELSEKNLLSDYEEKDGQRFRMLLDELAGIQKNLDFLANVQRPSINDYLDFERVYKGQVSLRHENLIPPYIDTVQKFPIDTLYVHQRFSKVRPLKGENTEPLSEDEFRTKIYRTVILGNPGGGKSTFVTKLCHDLAISGSERILVRRKLTPIFVVLRDYGTKKKSFNFSLLQYIESVASSDYQIEPPPGAFEYLLLNGRVMVVFDGLDELLDTHHRQEVSKDVEAFCNLYPAVPVVITSREVGYEQSPLDNKRFAEYILAPFNDEQVEYYVNKWFSVQPDFNKNQQVERAKSFLRESQLVYDLRSNPLMLALMCNIYRGENYIPKNRPDVYEKCAIMLFERWDKGRGIQANLPFEAHIRSTMMFLAHWIYSNEDLQSGVVERKLVEETAKYLLERRYDDLDQAEFAATEFVKFCRGRAWVFTDTGTTKVGEPLYQFTHRTFLEYFAASYMVRTHVTPESLAKYLFPRIAKREWDVVAQLAFQVQNKNVEGAGDELLERLIEYSFNQELLIRGICLSFAARCLEFIVPKPSVVRTIAAECIKYCVDYNLRDDEDDNIVLDNKKISRKTEIEGVKPRILLENLIPLLAEENTTIVADAIKNSVLDIVNSSNKHRANRALEIGLHLQFVFSPRIRLVETKVNYWSDLSEEILKEVKSAIPKLYPTCKRAGIDAFLRGEITVDKLIKLYGIKDAFVEHHHNIFKGTYTISPCEVVLGDYYNFNGDKRNKKRQSQLKNNLEALSEALDKDLSLLSHIDGHYLRWRISNIMEEDKKKDKQISVRLNNKAIFGLFLISAASLESMEGNLKEDELKRALTRLEPVSVILGCRFLKTPMGDVINAIQKYKFTREQKKIVTDWIGGKNLKDRRKKVKPIK